MTERSACSVGEEGHLKEMSNALSMDAPNARPHHPSFCCPAGSLAALIGLRRVALI